MRPNPSECGSTSYRQLYRPDLGGAPSQEEGGGGYPRQQLTTYHTSSGIPKKNGVRKIPLAPFGPPPFLPAAGRDQRNVDSTSAAVRGAARGLLYRHEQMAVAQVNMRLVSPVARPPYYAPTRLLLGGGTPLPLPPTTTPGEILQNSGCCYPDFFCYPLRFSHQATPEPHSSPQLAIP